MTASTILAQIAFEGQRGMTEGELARFFCEGLAHTLEHLAQLRLIVQIEDNRCIRSTRYVASTERGWYVGGEQIRRAA